MTAMRRWRRTALITLVVLAVLVPVAVLTTRFPATDWRGLVPGLFGQLGGERSSGFTTIVDDAGSALLRTGFLVTRGDTFIDPDGVWHRVVAVQGKLARSVVVPAAQGTAQPGSTTQAAAAPSALPLGAAKQVIVIYHTHSDESYVPTEGTDSIWGGGGIYAVGDAMAAGLTAAGFTVVNDRTPHDPHDGGAYPRSRRTVLNNLRFGPTLLFDVHRDSAPASEYLTTIGGVETTKVMIVVGGGNPLYKGNLAVANRLKAAADSLYPGLIRGILVAKGNYNQDLAPSDILLEVGADTNPKPAAEHAGALWANVVSAYLGTPGPAPAAPPAPTP